MPVMRMTMIMVATILFICLPSPFQVKGFALQRVHPSPSSSYARNQFRRIPDTLSPPKSACSTTRLFNTLKPAAIPLMDAGKALARSGELLIDKTNEPDIDLYGGSLSAAGAQVRNAGDSVAQAAASCRFKTGVELVTDELREAATCLTEALAKLQTAVQEAEQDEMTILVKNLDTMLDPMEVCANSIEAAGASLLQRQPVTQVGLHLSNAGQALQTMSTIIPILFGDDTTADDPGVVSGHRMAYAATKIVEAGNALQGIPKEKPKGRAFLKGGGF